MSYPASGRLPRQALSITQALAVTSRPEAIAETEVVCGYRLPPLMTRLPTEVANGGFDPHNAVKGLAHVNLGRLPGRSAR